MAPSGNKQDKLEALFNIYDVDGDGRINKNDLKYVLELVTIRPKTEDEKKGITKSKKGKSEEELEEEDRLLAEEKDKNWDDYIRTIINRIMFESSSHPMSTSLSAEDFSKAISESRIDFQEKMNMEFEHVPSSNEFVVYIIKKSQKKKVFRVCSFRSVFRCNRIR